jgi:hypothetical protein
MKVLFHHEAFDIDVSSGTVHAAYQWVELLAAFGVTHAAVLNTSGVPWPHHINLDLTIEEYTDIASFSAAHAGETVIGTSINAVDHYRGFDYSVGVWVYIGGTTVTGLTCDYSVGITTHGNRELYPREAAAIILSEALL